jgi:hypothetical protein
LGGNSFSGSIPNVPITDTMTELVLSSNKLTGSIPNSIWQSNITNLDLSLNRLQGTLPSDMLPSAQFFEIRNASIKLQVNQLAGTIPSWLHNLPQGHIDILEGNLFSCKADRSDIPAHDPEAETYQCGSGYTNFGLMAFGSAAFCVFIMSSTYGYFVNKMPLRDIVIVFQKRYAEGELNMQLQHLQNITCVIAGMWLICMIVFGALAMQFSSYSYVYVLFVSAIYKMGTTPALTLLFVFSSALLVIFVCFLFILPNMTESEKDSNCSGSSSVRAANVNDILASFIIITVYITMGLAVNGFYVYMVVSGDYSFQLLIFIGICLSMFKIAWNYVLLTASQFVDGISDNMIIWLSLFNNLLAPLLAEMFVSSDCFLYIVSQAPSLIFNYDLYVCRLEDGTFFYVQEVCAPSILLEEGFGIVESVSIIPPFHYSYQCSFSLIASYVYVFIFRFTLTGLLEPLVQYLFYQIAIKYDVEKRVYVGQMLLPVLWQSILSLEGGMTHNEVMARKLKVFQDRVENGLLRRRFVVFFATDISMLICFGALFPPLALVIALSVLKDVVTIRLALRRYCEIMEDVQDESLKEQMMVLKECLDKDMGKAASVICRGVWHGVVMGTWIWAFVLFDTMASIEGVGKGFCVFVGMIACPFVLHYALQVAARVTQPTMMDDDKQPSRFDSREISEDSAWMHMRHITHNPILLNEKEIVDT